MSIIMPSGNNKLDWSPKGKMEKTAATGVVAEVDELLAAAKSVIKAQAIDACPVADDKPADAFPSEEKPDAFPSEEKPADIKDALKEVEVAVEKVEQAVDQAKDAAGVADEIEIEVEDVGAEKPEIEIEVEDGKPAVGGEDIIVKSEPEMSACGGSDKEVVEAKKKEEKKDDKKVEKCDKCKKDPCECKKASVEPVMPKSSSSTEEFCKFAMVSPENKKKIREYWVNALGYPADFVNLMIKDYEK